MIIEHSCCSPAAISHKLWPRMAWTWIPRLTNQVHTVYWKKLNWLSSPWDLPTCLTSVDLTTARILMPSRIAALLVMRMRPAAMKSHIPKCTGPVIKVEKFEEGGTSENENSLPCTCVGTRDDCGLLVLTKDIGQLMKTLVFWIDIRYE